ncbi:MAG: NADH-quinone oxidoreductase subunit J family protein [Candidatus Kapaibacteriales bacterium]
MSSGYLFFGILSILAIASALITISSKNPVRSAFALVFHFFMLACLYLSLNAQFLAVVQILVYAGAIMVLVIFVIMLLNLSDEVRLKEKFNYRVILAIFLGLAFIFQIIALVLVKSSTNPELHPASTRIGTVEYIGSIFFKNYIVSFEVIGILLLSAIIGAIVLAKKKIN